MEEILKILLHPAILIIQTPIDCKNLPRKEHIWQFADITPGRYNGLSKDVEAATRGVLQKKGVLKNFAEFTGKQLCQSLFFNKVAGLRCATLLKKKLWYRCFPVNFAKFFRTSFFTEHLRVTASEDAKSALMICYKEMCDKFTGQISFFFQLNL